MSLTTDVVDLQLLNELPLPRGEGSWPRILRVLHVINGEHYAGAERVQDLLALRLPDERVIAGFACLKAGQFAAARAAKATPLYCATMRGRWDLRPAKQLARLVTEEGYDLIHTHSPRAALVGSIAARRAGVPLVHHVHGQTAIEVGSSLRKRLSASVERRCLRHAAAVIAVSESARQYIVASGVAAEHVWVVPNGVPERRNLPHRSAPSGDWIVGMVAWLRPRKGLETLLEAAAKARAAGVPVKLRLVGRFESDVYQQQVLELTAKLGIDRYVEWVGFTRQVDKQLDQMDLLALPSLLAEGLPMVAIEAMAAGVPVIGSRVAGIVDCVADGREGLLVPPGDSTALVDALGRFTSGQIDWQAMSRRAIARQHEEFSDTSMAKKVAMLYRQVLTTPDELRAHGENEASGATIAGHSTSASRDRVTNPTCSKLFGITIDRLDKVGAAERIRGWIAEPQTDCQFVVTPNVDHIVQLQKDPRLVAAYREAGMVLADGAPVVWAAHLLGQPLPERVAGSDLVPEIFDQFERQATELGMLGERMLRVFILGGMPGVPERASRNIESRWPHVCVVGTSSPPLGFEYDRAQCDEILTHIDEARTDLLLVCLGAPKQELWVQQHRLQIAAPVALCVGATVDFLAGTSRRAPRWMQRVGLEWMHRLLGSPRRLAGRYLRDAVRFPRIVWRQYHLPV